MNIYVTIALVAVTTLLIIWCILQVLWIRSKLSAYTDTNLSSQLDTQSKMLMALNAPKNTVKVCSLKLDVRLTYKINQSSALEAVFLAELTTPNIFNIPHVCGNVTTSLNLSCTSVSFLVITNDAGASDFVIDLQNGAIVYIMINKVLYFADFNMLTQTELKNSYPDYTNSYVIYLYTIISAGNTPYTADNTCTIDITPFFGTISTDASQNVSTLLSTSNIQSYKAMHVLAFTLQKN